MLVSRILFKDQMLVNIVSNISMIKLKIVTWKYLFRLPQKLHLNRHKLTYARNIFCDFRGDKTFTGDKPCDFSLIFRGDKTLMVRQQNSSLNPSLSPCLSSGGSGHHFLRLFQKEIEGFDWTINCQALGAALRHTDTALTCLTRKQQYRMFPSWL